MGLSQLAAFLAGGRRRRDLYSAGMTALNKGDFQAAVAALGAIADQDNLHGRLARFYVALAHRQLGLIALERAEHATAVEQLRAACRYNPAGGELARLLAAACAGAGRMDQAAAALDRALSADPGDLRARSMLAIAQWRTGQIDLAELTLHQGLGATGEPPAIRFLLGLLAAQVGRWDQVEHHLTLCVQADEENAAAWRYLGLACGAQDRPKEAVEHLRRSQRLSPADPHVALELAIAASAASAGPLAVRRLSLAELTGRQPASEQAEGLDRLARAILAEPEFIEAFLDLPASPMDVQIFAVLELSLRRTVAARPTYADLHYFLSRVHERVGRISDAIDSVEQAIAINPRYVTALIHAAGLYHQTAQRGTSAERLRAAIAAGGDYPDVHLLLGHLYRDLGQTERARRSYQRALQLKPNYAAAKEALEALAA